MFTQENTDGFSDSDLELMNSALTVYIKRNRKDDDSEYNIGQIEKSGSDLINNNWNESGNTIESLLRF